MITSRCATDGPLLVTMMPPLASLANLAIARSTSLSTPTLTGRNSSPNDGANASAAAHCPIPAAVDGSRSRAARVGTRSARCASPAPYRGRARRQNDVRRECHQFRRLSANLGGVARGPVDVDPHVATVDPAQFLQCRSEGGDPGLIFRVVLADWQEDADKPRTIRRLRARRDRPRRRRAGHYFNDVAPPHLPHPKLPKSVPQKSRRKDCARLACRQAITAGFCS